MISAKDLCKLGHWQGDQSLVSAFVAHPGWCESACAAMLATLAVSR